jgi:putative membrane protein
MTNMMWHGAAWGGWIRMSLLMLVLGGGLIAAVELAARALGVDSRSRGGASVSRRADELLTERFACGEIDVDEFRRRMALLCEHR